MLVNAVDRPSLCDFATPAIVERGPLAIALGTDGAAPALARDLRARVEAAVPPAFGRLAALCGRWRARVAAALPEKERRRRFWDELLDGPAAAAVAPALRAPAPGSARGDDPAGAPTTRRAAPQDVRSCSVVWYRTILFNLVS